MKPDSWSSLPISMVARHDEGHDLTDRQLAALDQQGAESDDGDHRDGGCGARQDGHQAPPGQHGILRRQQLAHEVLMACISASSRAIALHHRDVAEHVADPPVRSV